MKCCLFNNAHFRMTDERCRINPSTTICDLYWTCSVNMNCARTNPTSVLIIIFYNPFYKCRHNFKFNLIIFYSAYQISTVSVCILHARINSENCFKNTACIGAISVMIYSPSYYASRCFESFMHFTYSRTCHRYAVYI